MQVVTEFLIYTTVKLEVPGGEAPNMIEFSYSHPVFERVDEVKFFSVSDSSGILLRVCISLCFKCDTEQPEN